jgi:hypothetical protein
VSVISQTNRRFTAEMAVNEYILIVVSELIEKNNVIGGVQALLFFA